MMFVSVLHDNSRELVGVNAATLGQAVLQHPLGGYGTEGLAILENQMLCSPSGTFSSTPFLTSASNLI